MTTFRKLGPMVITTESRPKISGPPAALARLPDTGRVLAILRHVPGWMPPDWLNVRMAVSDGIMTVDFPSAKADALAAEASVLSVEISRPLGEA